MASAFWPHPDTKSSFDINWMSSNVLFAKACWNCRENPLSSNSTLGSINKGAPTELVVFDEEGVLDWELLMERWEDCRTGVEDWDRLRFESDKDELESIGEGTCPSGAKRFARLR